MASSSFDASEFLKGLDLANKAVQRGGKRGFALGLAWAEKRGKELAPIDQSGQKPGGTLNATITGDASTIKITEDEISAILSAGGGEASDYAVKQHEIPMTHSYPHSGVYASKFIETPLKELAEKFPAVLAAEIRKELDSGGSGS